MFDNAVVQWFVENEQMLLRWFSAVGVVGVVTAALWRRAVKARLQGTPEQNALFGLLKAMLASANGWSRLQLLVPVAPAPNTTSAPATPPAASNLVSGIKYAWPNQGPAPANKPEVKVSWGPNRECVVFVGNEVVSNAKLTNSQVRKVSKMASRIKTELEAQSKAGEINRILASLR